MKNAYLPLTQAQFQQFGTLANSTTAVDCDWNLAGNGNAPSTMIAFPPQLSVLPQTHIQPLLADFYEQMEKTIRHDIHVAGSGLDESGEVPATAAAERICIQIAQAIMASLHHAPEIRYTASIIDAGGTTLVIDNVKTRRRLSLNFTPDASAADAFLLGSGLTPAKESMTTSTIPIERYVRWLGQ